MDQEIIDKWKCIEEKLTQDFGKKPDLNGVLFLIGIRELGQLKKKFTKEEKVNLMHTAVCKLLSQSGYYRLAGVDKDGWPHWENIKPLPFIDVFQQETFLKFHIVEYFDQIN